MVSVAALVPLVLALVAAGVWLGRLAARRQAEAWTAGVRGVVDAIKGAAAAERSEALKAAQLSGRDDALTRTMAFDTFCQVREAELGAAAARVARREADLAAEEHRVEDAQQALEPLRARVAEREA